MNRCPITYEMIDDKAAYSVMGLRLLSKKLHDLQPFPYDMEGQLRLAREMAAKISIQGVQPKISARLDIQQQLFVPVEIMGHYILKPQNQMYSHLPENEDVTMKLAAAAGCEVPLHGLMWSKDGRLTFFIRRFDRTGRAGKLPIEDFAQLAGLSRDTKYDYSIEKIIRLIDKYMTFPVIEKAKFFRLFLVNFLVGNEDAHLKNYSLLTRSEKQELSPCYDIVNSTLALEGRAAEESALALNGKKRNLTKKDIIGYLGVQRLTLTDKILNRILSEVKNAAQAWPDIIEKSFLPTDLRAAYRDIVRERWKRLFE
jgi:serine/threonine-protein kinase HipA